MKKRILLIILALFISGCQNKYIAVGSYKIETKNNRPIYLIDINTGERFVELNNGEFYINVLEEKKIASFLTEITNFNTESVGNKTLELGFFNGQVSKDKADLLKEGENESIDAIVIQPNQELFNASNDRIIGLTLSSYGPTLYDEIKEGYCYFYLGPNYLKVKEDAITLVKKPDKIDDVQVFDGDLGEFAYNLLAIELQMMIYSRSEDNVLIDQQYLDNNGVMVFNKDMSREYRINNQEVILVTYLYLSDVEYTLTVYVDPNSYSFLGVTKDKIEIYDDFE